MIKPGNCSLKNTTAGRRRELHFGQWGNSPLGILTTFSSSGKSSFTSKAGTTGSFKFFSIYPHRLPRSHLKLHKSPCTATIFSAGCPARKLKPSTFWVIVNTFPGFRFVNSARAKCAGLGFARSTLWRR